MSKFLHRLIISSSARRARFGLAFCLVFIAACSSPSERFDTQANALGFERKFAGAVQYRNGKLKNGARVHIYLDGDGTPALRHGRIARDPSSRDRLILGLMGRDPTPAVLIGRPCYYGDKDNCDSSLWTTERYSKTVVERLRAGVMEVLRELPDSPVTLIGYSGGGTLAMLLAPTIQRLDSVVTVAANLDTDAWVAHHNYAPLIGSLNPALQAPLPAHIKQWHYIGAADENVPAETMAHVVARQANAELVVLAGHDHSCCWEGAWASILQDLAQALTN